MFRGTSLDQHI